MAKNDKKHAAQRGPTQTEPAVALKGQFRFHEEFRPEYSALDKAVKKELAVIIKAVQALGGPSAGRPLVDTLNGSEYMNMKELIVPVGNEVYRFAFAYDPTRDAIVLCGGDKQGVSQTLFYKQLIKKADKRFKKWLAGIDGKQDVAVTGDKESSAEKRRSKKGAKK